MASVVMNASPSILKVTVSRDSVCAGDDLDDHRASFEIATTSTVLELLRMARAACPLASIAGGQATWLVDVAVYEEGCIGVIAQQWQEPKLVIPVHTTVGALFGAKPPSLYFRYWCQAAPQAVFNAVQSNAPLPPRYVGQPD